MKKKWKKKFEATQQGIKRRKEKLLRRAEPLQKPPKKNPNIKKPTRAKKKQKPKKITKTRQFGILNPTNHKNPQP